MKDNSYTKFLEELKSKVDFVGIVSRYTTLKQRGRNFWGCCPFHHEKTPSFTIDPYEGFFHCFGCKEGGDVVKFVQKIENCSFADAISMLAKSCNMEVPVYHQDENIVAQKKLKEKILNIMKLAAEHYHENLYLPDAKKAQDYIKTRGFTRHELDDFYLGYSKDWYDIIHYIKKKGYTEEEMLQAGLIQKNEQKGTVYDTQGERLVFPIFNAFGECIAFTSRALEKTEYAKYKNTPETLAFNKSRSIFAINLVNKYKKQVGIKNIIICEGQIDVIAMHRAGFKNTVACLGTALTPYHARMLKQYTDNIVLCFDGDGAGTKATLRAIDILKEANLEVKIVSLPEGKDPDEILKEKGVDYLKNEIENAKSIMDFYIDYELKQVDIKKPDEKGKFIKNVLSHLKKQGIASMQDPYLEKIRDLTNVPLEILRRDLSSVGQAVNKIELKSTEQKEATLPREQGNQKAAKFIIASLLHKKDFVKENVKYRSLIPNRDYIFDLIDERVPISSIFDRIEVEQDPFLADVIYFDFNVFNGNEERYFEECLRVMLEEKLKNRKEELTSQFKTCEDIDERRKLLVKLAEINKKLIDKNLEDIDD